MYISDTNDWPLDERHIKYEHKSFGFALISINATNIKSEYKLIISCEEDCAIALTIFYEKDNILPITSKYFFKYIIIVGINI